MLDMLASFQAKCSVEDRLIDRMFAYHALNELGFTVRTFTDDMIAAWIVLQDCFDVSKDENPG